MSKKLIILIAALFVFLTFSPTNAQVDNTSKIPELNPFCWRRADCYKVRTRFLPVGTPATPAELEKGFITDASVAPCVGGTGENQWGRCLPAGVSKTEISFGGKSEFSNVGEFIVLMYKYLLTIASIVAVVVIIISGAQWITSGGNSEAIGSAKKRIGGAIIGLFIAYMSYFVLNTINPALVNLRLPQVWMLKPVSLTPEFCQDLERMGQEGKFRFMYAASPSEQAKPVSLETAEGKNDGFKWTNPKTDEKFACGSRFFVESGGQSACRGRVCDDSEESGQQSCLNRSGDRKNYECGNARVFGEISYSSIATACGLLGRAAGLATSIVGPWGCRPINNELLTIVCKDSQPSKDDAEFGSGHGESTFHYWIDSEAKDILEGNILKRCDNRGGVKGFVVKFEMEEDYGFNEYHYVGRNGAWLGGAGAPEYESNVFPNLFKVRPDLLFSLEEILAGVRLDVDAADIPSTDGTATPYNNRNNWEPQYQDQ